MTTAGKVLLGTVIVGGGALLLTRVGQAAPAPPPSLVDQYLAEIAAATTYAQLDNIRYRFEADYTAGKMTYDLYVVLYSAYAQKYSVLIP
ncbi:MAG: hypothetical protein KJ624_08315 [Chloroflexi bacterium]|nr:hypothetical protein [Chloroflexota bacterium]